MAEDELNSVLLDLQRHLKTARVDVNNLSTIAQKGNDKLVEKFMTEKIFVRSNQQTELAESQADVLESQLYVACFWGFRDVVKGILELAPQKGIDISVNSQNKDTLWTPLHAATFQEHGPVIMLLLQHGAATEVKDAEGRSPKDFASASDKVWGHFAAKGLKRTPKSTLIDMGILKKLSPRDGGQSTGSAGREPGKGIRLASYDRPESAYAYNSDPFLQAAATGDVLANDEESSSKKTYQPQLAAFK